MFEYTWAVTVRSDRELSEDAVNVISDMKAEFADAVDAIVELDFSDDESGEFVPQTVDSIDGGLGQDF